MALDAKHYYDAYWGARESASTEARSRERALAAIELLALHGLRGGRLLDAGCGPGWTLEAFRDAGFDAVGLDASERAVQACSARGLDVRQLDFEKERLEAALGPGSRFRAIACLEVLEHLVDPLAFLEELKRYLEPGGALVVSLPNELALPARAKVLLGRLPFGGHDDPHVRHFDRTQARRLLDSAGLRTVRDRPLSVFPPRWRLARAVTGWLPRSLPGLFSLASVHLLVPREPQ